MSYRVEVFFSPTNAPAFLQDEWKYSFGDGRAVLAIFQDDKCIWSEADRGEPEDNSFGRDYSWIKPRLEEAYRLGKLDALTEVDGKEGHIDVQTEL